MTNIKSENRGRRRKLNLIEERLVYEKKISGLTVTEIAFTHGISTKTVDRIVKRIKDLQD